MMGLIKQRALLTLKNRDHIDFLLLGELIEVKLCRCLCPGAQVSVVVRYRLDAVDWNVRSKKTLRGGKPTFEVLPEPVDFSLAELGVYAPREKVSPKLLDHGKVQI